MIDDLLSAQDICAAYSPEFLRWELFREHPTRTILSVVNQWIRENTAKLSNVALLNTTRSACYDFLIFLQAEDPESYAHLARYALERAQ